VGTPSAQSALSLFNLSVNAVELGPVYSQSEHYHSASIAFTCQCTSARVAETIYSAVMKPDATQYPAASSVLTGMHASSKQAREPLTPLTLAGSWNASASLFADLKEQDVTQYETALYASGSLPRPKNFSFSDASIRIDWRALAGVDIDHLVCKPLE
jgi:hypothetical protein